MELRKKGIKPPSFINKFYEQPATKESRMTKTIGKRPMQEYIQCWSCKGDHMYRDFPRRSERVKTPHNMQKDEIIEDVGRSVPKIYATLDKKKVKFQSNMIEVEGKINNHPIAILIDSGASHSYLNPKMVERFHFPRSNLGKT